MICDKCKQPIKWIATKNDIVVKCSDVKEVFYTEQGRRQEGYRLHICQEEKNENGNSTSES